MRGSLVTWRALPCQLAPYVSSLGQPSSSMLHITHHQFAGLCLRMIGAITWEITFCSWVDQQQFANWLQKASVWPHHKRWRCSCISAALTSSRNFPQTCGTTINCWQVHSQMLLDQTFKLSSLSLSVIWNAHKNSRASPQSPVSISPTWKCHWCYCLKRYHFIMPKYFTVHTKGNKVLTSMG